MVGDLGYERERERNETENYPGMAAQIRRKIHKGELAHSSSVQSKEREAEANRRTCEECPLMFEACGLPNDPDHQSVKLNGRLLERPASHLWSCLCPSCFARHYATLWSGSSVSPNIDREKDRMKCASRAIDGEKGSFESSVERAGWMRGTYRYKGDRWISIRKI